MNADLPVRFNSACLFAGYVIELKFIQIQRFIKKIKSPLKVSILSIKNDLLWLISAFLSACLPADFRKGTWQPWTGLLWCSMLALQAASVFGRASGSAAAACFMRGPGRTCPQEAAYILGRQYDWPEKCLVELFSMKFYSRALRPKGKPSIS